MSRQSLKNILPDGIELNALQGYSRRERTRGFQSNDISWNSDHSKFLLAYTIVEESMGNPTGNICLGKVVEGRAEIIWNPKNIFIMYRLTDWCSWLNIDTVVFKSQKYNPNKMASYGGHVHVPLICINSDGKSLVINGTNNLLSKPSDCLETPAEMTSLSESQIIEKIYNCG